jgi:hypothetical protein
VNLALPERLNLPAKLLPGQGPSTPNNKANLMAVEPSNELLGAVTPTDYLKQLHLTEIIFAVQLCYKICFS